MGEKRVDVHRRPRPRFDRPDQNPHTRSPGVSGSMPPCMQTSVATHEVRLIGPLGDLVGGQ